MSELRDLYQQIIIDHSKNPRHFCVIEHPDHVKEGYNPLCGDKLTLYLTEKNGVITDICFQGSGCAISMASASLMTEAIKGKTIAETMELFDEFQRLLTTGDQKDLEKLGKLAVLAGVAEFPMRVKCATLAWHTLKSALKSTAQEEKVTTE
ncbi:MAG: SUF system NifU family Fe-S cluster assembly protein [Gammaproteobacteria bacterium]|nr:SUF system NifU family Fe-S cluster assembly protein [Gammaproteobacteria bacterium]